MAFDLLERSLFGGSPVELYEFFLLGQTWRYTTDDRITTFNSADYLPVSAIERGAFKLTGDQQRADMQIRVRGNLPITELFRVAPPSEPVQLRIFKKHRGDSDFIIRWRGRVLGCTWENGDWATLLCSPITSTLKQPGLRRSYSLQCPYALYDTGCRVDRSAYEVTGEVTAINGLVVTINSAAGFAAGWFAGGYVLWENIAGKQDSRMVMSSLTDGKLTMQHTTIGLSVGDSIKAYPGCDHLISTCLNKFNNTENYGGMPFIPKTNPFGATIF